MVYDVQKVIDTALAEVNYLEKASNANLDDKTANAGSANYTKYARDLAEVNFFNGRKQGREWCAVFVGWIFWKPFGKEAALKLLCQPSKDNCGAGCNYIRKYFKAKGQWHTSNPKPGDVIVFYSRDKSSYSHTGFVYKVDAQKVYTVEGNTSGSSGVIANGGGVFKKSYSLTYGRIAGYGRPAYGDIAVNGTETGTGASAKKDGQEYAQNTEAPTGGKTEGKAVMIELTTLKNGSKGNQVKTVQRLFNALGYDCGTVDGVFGNKTKAATKAFQKAKGLDADGVIGKNTWSALLK